MKQQTFVVLGASTESLVNFRISMIENLAKDGYRVIAMSPEPRNDFLRDAVKTLPADFVGYPLVRNSLSPLTDLVTFYALVRRLRKIKPDIVFTYNIKPIIWGSLTLRWLHSKARFVVLIEGMGFAFQDRVGWRRWLKKLLIALSRIALHRASRVIFLNQESRDEFVAYGIIPHEKTVLLDGIGVDLDRFAYSPLKSTRDESPVFVCVARLMNEKGLCEYVEAAKRVQQHCPDARFLLAGPEDPSPDGIAIDQVYQWQQQGVIEYLGELSDVRDLLEESHVFVLPSYHEGLPRSIMEAMAIGRPILTTDIPGCRRTVEAGRNGFLVPPRDVDALTERMLWFIDNADCWQKMGLASRAIAEQRFDVRVINKQLMHYLFSPVTE